MKAMFPLLLAASALVSCVPMPKAVKTAEAPVSRLVQKEAQAKEAIPAQKRLKRKIAIGRFTNETNYGKSLLTDASLDPIGKQASDMLANRLTESGEFLVFERPDLSKIEREQAISGDKGLIGVDALVLGSVTEFGRQTTGQYGFLSASKTQTARAKVEARLADVKTGHVFFTAEGTGEASTATGNVAGFGSGAEYDATLNDRAIGAALSDLTSHIADKLKERPWRTAVLKRDGKKLYIGAGERQGIAVGQRLAVMQKGEVVKNPQSGFDIELPGTKAAEIEIVSVFGNSETDEGALAVFVGGAPSGVKTDDLYVSELP
jgi:curli biogenesis system outer membrane secretion channel CsgG